MIGRRTPAFSGMDERTLLSRLRAVDFALQDTALYLDAYPESKEALDYYQGLLESRRGLLSALPESTPLTMYENTGNAWNWADGPWPWEPDAN